MSTVTQKGPDGQKFVWDRVSAWHEIGEYVIAETSGGKFHPYVCGCDTSHTFSTLDEALVYAIAYRNMEVNAAGWATRFFAVVLKLDADA